MDDNADEEVNECLKLIKNDIYEATIADELLYVIESHVNSWDDPPEKLEPGLQFMVETLAFRMALAINRLFQAGREDRANFAQLREFSVGLTSATLDDALEKAAKLGESDALRRLKACRNGFMAHSLRGPSGHRVGMQTSMLSDTLHEAEQVFEAVHQALTGNSANLAEFREKWRRRSAEFWRNRLPVQATSQPDGLESTDQVRAGSESGKSILDGRKASQLSANGSAFLPGSSRWRSAQLGVRQTNMRSHPSSC